jgi:polysaccharide chain length determinant protein (PEP-CTERM system associated)
MLEVLPQIRFYAAGLWARRWSIILVAWLVSLAGWTVVALLPNSYTAKAQVYVDTQSILGPLMRNLTVIPDLEGQVQMMRQTLLSRPNLEELVRVTDLDLDVQGSLAYENLLKRLARDIEVQPINATLLEIRYAARDPELAHRVVEAVLDLFVKRNVGHAQRDVDAAQAFIDKQISEYEAKLRQADLALAGFKREHAAELGGTERAQRELEDARAAKRTIESERASAGWQREQLALQLASTPRRLSRAETSQGLTPAEARLTALRTELDQLLLVFTDRHPGVINMQRLVGQAEEVVARERAGQRSEAMVANPLVVQLEEQLRGVDLRRADLDRRIKLAGEEIDRLALKVAESPQIEADLLRLTRDYDALSKNYQELVQRRETAHLAKQMDSETSNIEFRVVEPPVVPLLPSSPRRTLLMLAVSLAGLGCGAGLAALRLALRREVVRPEQLLETFDLPVLGTVREVRLPGAHPFRAADFATVGLLLALYAGCSGGLVYLYRSNPVREAPSFVDGGAAWLGRQLQTITASRATTPASDLERGRD